MYKEKIIAVVPARLNSSRLPNKLLMNLGNMSILEHVINRLIISKCFNKIIIASPNIQLKKITSKYKETFFFKSRLKHFSGTSRAIEAVKNLHFSKLVILFGDEPLIRPNELRHFTKKIRVDDKSNIWNATIDINHTKELRNQSIVKCYLDSKGKIIDLKRQSKSQKIQNLLIQKSVGLLAFKKNILNELDLKKNNESIEQLNFINDEKFFLKSVKLKHNFFSINNRHEYQKVISIYKNDKIQKKIISSYNKT